jgi:hypothetical protein
VKTPGHDMGEKRPNAENASGDDDQAAFNNH